MNKVATGNFFEDFSVGQVLAHATPRTVTSGDVALYQAFYGSRFAAQSSAEFARGLGYPDAPVDDLLVFHIVFGKTVPDISLNAVANLGYADCRFLRAVHVGETLHARSEVIGLKENSNGKTGVVYVRSTGFNQNGEPVLTFARWVMVMKRDEKAPAPSPVVPELPDAVAAEDLAVPVPERGGAAYDVAISGSPYVWDDYEVGECIDHVDGMTVEEAEHQMATRLYQNTARVHFNEHVQRDTRFGRRLVYGGVVISIARALSFNGLGNAIHIAAINSGRHAAPVFAGDTVYAGSEIIDRALIPSRDDLGALRVRLVASKNAPCTEILSENQSDKAPEAMVLELDHWLILPRRAP